METKQYSYSVVLHARHRKTKTEKWSCDGLKSCISDWALEIIGIITIAHIHDILARIIHFAWRPLRCSTSFEALGQVRNVTHLLFFQRRLTVQRINRLDRIRIIPEIGVFVILDNQLFLYRCGFFGTASFLELVHERVNVLDGRLHISNASSWNRLTK